LSFPRDAQDIKSEHSAAFPSRLVDLHRSWS
jgi:hypothetical protein